MGFSGSIISSAEAGNMIGIKAITLAFLILFTTLSPCLAQGSSVDLSTSVATPTPTPTPTPIPVYGGVPVYYEKLGDIVAELRIEFLSDLVSRDETLSVLVTVINLEKTYNDVALKGEIMNLEGTVTYAHITESVRVGYGSTDKWLMVTVPDIESGDYIFRVSMIEPNNDVTIASKVFTVRLGLLEIITDLRVFIALMILGLVLYLYLTKEKICQTQAN